MENNELLEDLQTSFSLKTHQERKCKSENSPDRKAPSEKFDWIKSRQGENNELLEEMYRLIANEETDLSIYELSEEQLKAVEEGQIQYKNGQILTEGQADKDIEEWLNK